MKRFSVIFGLALGMLTVGCSQDMPEDALLPSNGNVVTLGVNISPSEDVRTSLGELAGGKYSVLWSEGDKLAVNGKTSSAVSAAQAGTTSATFTVEDVVAPFNVLYPAEALNADGSTVTIATEQVYTPGSFANGNAVLVGYSEDGTSVSAKHLYSFVKVNVVKGAEDVALKSVTVKALGGEAISGTFKVDYQNATITPAAGQDLARVSSAEPIAIGNGVSFVIAVPAGSYSAGFEITVADVNGKGMTRKATHPALANIPGGYIVNMPALTYAAEIPVSVATPITTAAQLQAFIAAVNAGDFSAYVMDNGEVVLGADIDLTGVTLSPIASFTGVFNGQGYALKNWTASRGLFDKNNGIVKNVVVDESCKLTADGSTNNVGFIVENNYDEAAKVIGCVNYGDVTVTDVSASGYRIGGVLGVSYGFVNNCVNYGDINVTSEAVNNTQCIGGVLGYTNPTARKNENDAFGKDFITHCINYGNVNVLFPCKPKTVHVGGVLGATVTSKSSAATYIGQIKNCSNLGKVSYRFETLDSGTYGNVGGVIGYSHANVENCNHYGEVSFTTPYEDLTKGGTRPALGGVVGCALYGVVNCNNYGKVYGAGCWAAGTNDNEGAGSQGGSSFGGVVGCAGVYNALSTEYKVEKCNNYGEVEVYNCCKTGGGTKGYQAGVAGYTSNNITDCHNYGVVNIKTNLYTTYSAGVVGMTLGTASKCSTDYPVSAEIVNIAKAGGEYYLSGVIGYASVGVEDCHLNANFTAKINNGSGSTRLTGVVGQVKTLTTRCVTVSNCSVKKGVKLSFTSDNDKANYCGGIVGLCNNGVSKCVNSGDIDLKFTKAFEDDDIVYLGGVAGAQQEDMTECTNNGNLTLDVMNGATPVYAATVLGSNKKAGATFSNCHNTGNLTITNAVNTEWVGLYVGNQADDTTADLSACTNTGTVTVNGNALQ